MLLGAFDALADVLTGHSVDTHHVAVDNWAPQLYVCSGHQKYIHHPVAFADQSAHGVGARAPRQTYHDAAAERIEALEAKLKKLHASLGIAEPPKVPYERSRQHKIDMAFSRPGPGTSKIKSVEASSPKSGQDHKTDAVSSEPGFLSGPGMAKAKTDVAPSQSGQDHMDFTQGFKDLVANGPAKLKAAAVAGTDVQGFKDLVANGPAKLKAAAVAGTEGQVKPSKDPEIPPVVSQAGADRSAASRSKSDSNPSASEVDKTPLAETFTTDSASSTVSKLGPKIVSVESGAAASDDSTTQRKARADIGECKSADGRYTVKVTPDGVRRLYDTQGPEGSLLTRIQCDGDAPKGKQGDCGKLFWPCENIHRPFKGYPEDIIDKVKPFCKEKGWHALFLGLGGGYMQTNLASQCAADARIDTLENSPGVVPVAKNMFGFNSNDPKQHLEFGDGVELMKHHASAGDKYDFIFTDHSSASSKEFMTSAQHLLQPGGRLAFSKMGEYQDEWLTSLKDFFSPATPTRTREGNYTLVVTPKVASGAAEESALVQPDRKTAEFDEAAGAALSRAKQTPPGAVPVDTAAAAFNVKPPKADAPEAPASGSKAGVAEAPATSAGDAPKEAAAGNVGAVLKASESDSTGTAVGPEAMKRPAVEAQAI